MNADADNDERERVLSNQNAVTDAFFRRNTVPKVVFREWPQDWFRVCVADSVVTGMGSWLSVFRSSYLHVGIRLFAVLTSSTKVSALQL